MSTALAQPHPHLELLEAVAERRHLVVAVSAHEFTQGTDELLVSDTVHVDLLAVVLQARQPSEMRVGHGLQEPVAGEGFLVGVRGPQAAVTVGNLAGDARFDGVAGRLLLAELAGDSLGHGHGGAVAIAPVAPALARGVGAAQGRLLEALDDVLQGHIPLEALQAPVVEGDDIAAGGALEGGDGLDGLAGRAAGHQDAVGTAEAQAVGTGQQEGVLE